MGVVIVKGERAVLGVNWSRPIVTSGDFATWQFQNYFGQYWYDGATENAGVENVAPDDMGGKRGSGKHGTI